MTIKFKSKDAFVSYGRRESLGFVSKLHRKLRLAGHDVWFDKVNIPDGDDYAARINHGIETAHNFVYIMAPRCMTSPYCLIELEYARILGKRVIPINQMVIFATDSFELSDGDKGVMKSFYAFHGMKNPPKINTSEDVLNRSHALIGRTDWLDGKEALNEDDCNQLRDWAQTYENHWHKHEDLEYLQTLEIPDFGQNIDSLDSVVERIATVLERHKTYIHQHTKILSAALDWDRNGKSERYLLKDKARQMAQEWLLTKFSEGEQQPCIPSDLQCELLCESRKSAENQAADVFICHVQEDRPIRDNIIQQLSYYAITVWQQDKDISGGHDYHKAVEKGIENATNILYLVSPTSFQSKQCQAELAHALNNNKRIIPLLIAETDKKYIPKQLVMLQNIDISDNLEQPDLSRLLKIIVTDAEYYHSHKTLLKQATKWKMDGEKAAYLLRGHGLINALSWLQQNQQRVLQPPTALHQEFISTSETAKGQLSADVFISYSSKNADFAHQINRSFKEAGKTTWFDQENVSSTVDFEKELYKGIDIADNIVFLISPDLINSEYFNHEVDYAIKHGKRIITVLCYPTNMATIPDELREIVPINFTGNSFGKAFLDLLQLIDLDREHAHLHTILQQRAVEWNENECSKDFLLNASAAENAEAWFTIAINEKKQPAPTKIQTTYLEHSRDHINELFRKERRRIAVLQGLLVWIVIGLFISIGLGVYAWKKSIEAERQKNEALVSQSLFLTKLGREKLKTGHTTTAGLLALEALPNKENKRPLVAQAHYLLYEILTKQRKIWQHLDKVNHISYSPDGKMLVTASEDGSAQVRYLSGKLVTILHGHKRGIVQALFSPDNQHILTISRDRTARLWNLSGELITEMTGHNDELVSAAFSSDNQYIVTASTDGTARLWSRDGQLLHVLDRHKNRLLFTKFSADNQFILTTSADKTIRVWNLNGDEVQLLEGHRHWVRMADFNPDGRYIVSGSDDSNAILWDLKTNTSKKLIAHTSWITAASFSPDGKLILTASRDGTARLWNIKGEQVQEFNRYDGWILGAFFNPDNKHFATISDDTGINVWDINGTFLTKIKGHTNTIQYAEFSPDGHSMLSASLDDTARLWVKNYPRNQELRKEELDTISVPYSDLEGLKKEAVERFKRSNLTCNELKEAFLPAPDRCCFVKHDPIRAPYMGGFVGDCKEGIAQGFGKVSGLNGYEGNFKDSKMHGHGVYTWFDGTRYEGEFRDDFSIKLGDMRPFPDDWYYEAKFLLKHGQINDAYDNIVKQLVLLPEHVPSLLLQGEILVRLNQLKEAQTVFEKALASDSDLAFEPKVKIDTILHSISHDVESSN
ncbi:MAG: TIR domain-containing protein [Thiotrichaceae bacterium]|nr:TIR domain-containing protein [Thiotrichaceae bacterium]